MDEPLGSVSPRHMVVRSTAVPSGAEVGEPKTKRAASKDPGCGGLDLIVHKAKPQKLPRTTSSSKTPDVPIKVVY